MAGWFNKDSIMESIRGKLLTDEADKRQFRGWLGGIFAGAAGLAVLAVADPNARDMLVTNFSLYHLPLYGIFALACGTAGSGLVALIDRNKNFNTAAEADEGDSAPTPKL